MSAADQLSAAKLRADLANVMIGREIVVREEVTSTNDCILQLVADEAPEGLVVFAEHQTAGRGQRGNFWESAAYKGLWFSVLLRPKIDLNDSARLTDWAAKMIAVTIESKFSLSATIKLPNDVYVDGRKVAGVLVEMRAQKQARHIAILGVGVNVNQLPDDFSEKVRESAVSLAMLCPGPLDRHLLAVALLRNLDRTYREIFA
jgi:BirA family transcriptional regulator, biotin operon repressor / biotin---[acetyl-CoA-carboxylase] ligase